MTKMVIIADDITGALDTCVKFAATGIAAKVCIDADADFAADGQDEILVLCVPTRHLPQEEAYQVIRRITARAVEAGVDCIFKKTDSALRGNVGAELCAVLDGSGGDTICFVPALPAMGRTTRGGIHYINDLPVAESVFGLDPFEPVLDSCIPRLLAAQCRPGTRILSGEETEADCPGEKTIRVFDCASQEDMDAIVERLERYGSPRLLAGCAGLAESLAQTMARREALTPRPARSRRLMVVCGSVNPITCRQMDHAEKNGFVRQHIPGRCLLEEDGLESPEGKAFLDRLWQDYLAHPFFILDTRDIDPVYLSGCIRRLSLEGVRQRIAAHVGRILKALVDRGADARMILVGGDTLLAFMETMEERVLVPVRELQPGVVLTKVVYKGKAYEVISKSGGFGGEDLLMLLLEETAGVTAKGVL